MSFGGSVSAMITTIKNNRRSRVSAFEKMERYSDVKYKEGTIDKKASPQLLREIRENIQRENRRNTRILVISMISIVLIIYILIKFA